MTPSHVVLPHDSCLTYVVENAKHLPTSSSSKVSNWLPFALRLCDIRWQLFARSEPVQLFRYEAAQPEMLHLGGSYSRLGMVGDGYLLHSPSPYRLWFRVGFDSGVKDPSQGNGLDCQRLLHEAEEECAAAF